MKKRKQTALQKRKAKERERAQRAAYLSGKIEPAKPKGIKARRAKVEEMRLAQIEAGAYRKRSAAETARLKRGDLLGDIMQLWDDAYFKYRRLREAGVTNAATAVYEQNFAGMNPYDKTLNENRAIAAQLKSWLRRKDTSPTRAKKNLAKMKKRVFDEFPDISDAEMSEFWELYHKYIEWSGGIPQGSKNYLKNFAKAYDVYRRSSNMSMEHLFRNAESRILSEYEGFVSENPFGVNPLGN